ncbi:metallophosphoesterase [Natronoarchaeum mannanilyticum]|uniref:metallophosphoesterase n=1 Tax=Natronoarchaeum mannanilyticum TaxID=926360 RepID=UPI003622DCFC
MAPPDASFRDRSLYLPAADALVCADLHVGRDRSSNVELPLGESDDLLDRIEALLSRFEPSEFVVAGDALHSFDRVPRGVATTFADLAELVADAGAEFVVTTGNHDTMLDSVIGGDAAATEVAGELADAATVADEYRLSGIDAVVLHGHEQPGADAEVYVCGHDHPAIRIEGKRHPCYLFGEGVRGGADVLVVPAFNRLAPGTLVNRARSDGFQSPLLDRSSAFRPIVRDDDAAETFWFPPLDELRSML